MKLPPLLREPLVHFLVIGALLFLAFFVLNPPSEDPAGTTIRVTQNDIDRFIQIFQKQWQRPPTQDELQSLIEVHIREEVLYREALALGLEQDDTIIRRRLAQKMDFLFADISDMHEPDEALLQAYFKENLEHYRDPERVSFSHIYFNPDKRGAQTTTQAQSLLDELQLLKTLPDKVENMGDRFMLNQFFNQHSEAQIARVFGREFAETVIKLPAGQWQGPVLSGYGLHLVFISDKQASLDPEFESVRERVKNDYMGDRRRELNEKAYQKLRERYRIEVENKG